MKKPILMLLFFSSIIFSQTNTIFSDNFIDNSKKWDTKTSSLGTVDIAEGKFLMDAISDNGLMSVYPVALPDSMNFSITVDAEVLRSNNYGFGIIYNYIDRDNYGVFEVTKDNYANAIQVFEGFEISTGWFQESDIPNTSIKRLKIERINEKINYYLNSKHIYTSYYYPSSGYKLGFVVYNNQKVKFDNLKVSSLGKADNTFQDEYLNVDLWYDENPVVSFYSPTVSEMEIYIIGADNDTTTLNTFGTLNKDPQGRYLSILPQDFNLDADDIYYRPTFAALKMYPGKYKYSVKKEDGTFVHGSFEAQENVSIVIK